MANRSNYYPRTLRLQSWEVQEYDREKLNNDSLKEKYSAKGLDIEMGAINEKIGVKLGLEDYVMMAKAGINKVQDFIK